MAYFEELNDIVLGVIGEYLLRNQNLCKMLYYYPETSCEMYNPYTQPDIIHPEELLMKHIYPMPKLPDPVTDQKGYLTVTLTGGNSVDKNIGFRQVNVQFDIIFHLNSWIVKNGFRPYFVASELDKMFNNQQLTLPIFNRSQFYGFRMKDYSSYFYGIQLIYTFYVNSNIPCSTLPIYEKTPFMYLNKV